MKQTYFGLSMPVIIPQVRESGDLIHTPQAAFEHAADIVKASQETFMVIDLNSRNKMLDRRIVGIGIVDACLVHPREVFKGAILANASVVILVHNHPGGDPSPSAEDVKLTRQMIEAGKIIGIKVLDHVVVSHGEKPFVSIRETGVVAFE